LIVFFVLLIGVSVLVYYGQWKTRGKALYFSGTIEATQTNLAFQVSGRVLHVLVNEGQTVAKDQILAELDPSEFQSRYDQAKATLEKSVSNQEQLSTMLDIYTKTLPAEISRAEPASRTPDMSWMMPGRMMNDMNSCSVEVSHRKRNGMR